MRIRLLGTVATGLVAAFATGAHAQDAAKGASPVGLEEVVVTAQRRGENLQSVPIAVTAATSQDLERSHIDTIEALTRFVPGLQVPSLVGAVSPSIRGVGTMDPSAANSSNVATYVDGIYYPALGASVFSLAGVERIEVLQGPQGTLFGRNANGGAIQVVTKDPSHTPSGMLRFGYGNYDTVSAGFFGETGVSDNIATSLAVSYNNQRDG